MILRVYPVSILQMCYSIEVPCTSQTMEGERENQGILCMPRGR